jgi:hypothetical protein
MARKGKATRIVMYPCRGDLRMTVEQHEFVSKQASNRARPISVAQLFRDWIDEKRGK